jgi:hypothetical protein
MRLASDQNFRKTGDPEGSREREPSGFAIATAPASNRLGQCASPAISPASSRRQAPWRPSLPSPPSSSPSGGSPGRKLLCQAPTVTNPRSVLRHMGEGSASGIVGLVRVM